MGNHVLLGLTGLLLAGCAHQRIPVAASAPPALEATAAPVSAAPTPINAGLSPAATLWHLRAALNVAALACRGEQEAALVSGYNALLAGHAAALKAAEAAYAAEYRAAGGDWRDRYDHAQTRLYNFFGQAHGRTALCTAAGEALTTAVGLDDDALPGFAQAQLAVLDQPFAPPRLAVDARVFDAAPAVMVASR